MKTFVEWQKQPRLDLLEGWDMRNENDAVSWVREKKDEEIRSIKKAIEDRFRPSAMKDQERRVFWLAVGQILFGMAQSYHATSAASSHSP